MSVFKTYSDVTEIIYRPITEMPRQGAVLDWLKAIAAILMVVDHINSMFLGPEVSLTLMGRIVFPAFALISAIHLERGIDPKRYFLKLLPFAVLSQVPHFFAFWPTVFEADWNNVVLNIIFTLGVGVLIAYSCAKFKLPTYLLFICALAYWSLGFNDFFEYGVMGLVLPAMFWAVLKKETFAKTALFLNLMLLNAKRYEFIDSLSAINPTQIFLTLFICIFIAVIILIALGLFLSALEKVRDDKRFLPKFFLHIFYPSHLAILAIIYWSFN